MSTITSQGLAQINLETNGVAAGVETHNAQTTVFSGCTHEEFLKGAWDSVILSIHAQGDPQRFEVLSQQAKQAVKNWLQTHKSP